MTLRPPFRSMLLSCLLGLTLCSTAWADARLGKVTVSVPGPNNISYLPIDLISKIGADRAEGFEIKYRHTGGGGVALQELSTRNSDFVVAGFPAAMSMRANGGDVVGIAAVNDQTLFILMVRSELKGKVKTIADLRGRMVGVNTSSLSSKTTSQQLAELLLQNAGIPKDEMRLTAAGQSWIEQSSVLESGSADAIMGDEPFATRLLKENKVFWLANLADPATSKKIPGAGFLHAALSTRSDMIKNQPAKVDAMVRAVRRTLMWMASHKPEEIVAKLDLRNPEERASLIESLRKYSRLYSPDGKFSTRQLQETEHFFHTTTGDNPAAKALRIESMIDDRWSGRKP